MLTSNQFQISKFKILIIQTSIVQLYIGHIVAALPVREKSSEDALYFPVSVYAQHHFKMYLIS